MRWHGNNFRIIPSFLDACQANRIHFSPIDPAASSLPGAKAKGFRIQWMSISTNYHQLRIQWVWIYIYICIPIKHNIELLKTLHVRLHLHAYVLPKLEQTRITVGITGENWKPLAWTCSRTTNPRPRAYRERFSFGHSWRLQPKRPPGGVIFSPCYMDDPNSPNCVGWGFSPRLSQAGSAVGCSQNNLDNYIIEVWSQFWHWCCISKLIWSFNELLVSNQTETVLHRTWNCPASLVCSGLPCPFWWSASEKQSKYSCNIDRWFVLLVASQRIS